MNGLDEKCEECGAEPGVHCDCMGDPAGDVLALRAEVKTLREEVRVLRSIVDKIPTPPSRKTKTDRRGTTRGPHRRTDDSRKARLKEDVK